MMLRIAIFALMTAAALWGQGGRGQGGRGQNAPQANRPNNPNAPNQPPNQQGQGAAPQAAATLEPGTVAGRVTSATTGEPLRKVSLTLRPSGRGGGPSSATSDNEGNFKFTGVDPGKYTLLGQRTGFVRQAYGESSSSSGTVIEIAAAQTVSGIGLKLMPQSVIAGRVADEDGDPVQGVNVQVWHYSFPRGQRQLTLVQNGSTNDLGEFRIPSLPPGRYYVSATAPRRTPQGGGRVGAAGRAGRGANRKVEEDTSDYVTTYFPRGTDLVSAAPLDATAGSELRGIEIRLTKMRLFNIRGVVTGMAAPSQDKGGRGGRAGLMVNLAPRSASAPRDANRFSAPANPDDGTFEFLGVPPGSYVVVAQAPGQAQQRMTARTAVDLGNSNVNNITLRLQPPVSVTAVARAEGSQTAPNLGSIRMNFVPADNVLGGGGGNAGQAKADGTFQTQLAADKYSLEVSGLPDGYYVKSIRLGGREVPDALLDFSATGGQVEVVLGSDAKDLTGQVQNAKGEPAGGILVTAAPTSAAGRRDLYKSVNTDTNGNFTIRGLPPGDYKLLAWEEVEANAWMDKDFRQPFDGWSATAKVSETTSSSIILNLIGRAQVASAMAKMR